MNILLVDEQHLFRQGVAGLLHQFVEGLNIFEAANASDALEICKKKTVDIVILELGLPVADGTELALHFQKWRDRTFKVMVVSRYADVLIVNQLLESGVDGYLPKSSNAKTLVQAIQQVLKGNIYFPDEFDLGIKNLIHSGEVPLFKLSLKEREIIKHLSMGKTNKEIAEVLGYTVRTIETKRYRIEKKFYVRGSAHLVSVAYRTGILRLN